MLLGDLGAEVIKVEQPEQWDDTRSWRPPFLQRESAYFLSMNRNKKNICLDLQQADDLEVAHQLMRQSDIRVFASPPATVHFTRALVPTHLTAANSPSLLKNLLAELISRKGTSPSVIFS